MKHNKKNAQKKEFNWWPVTSPENGLPGSFWCHMMGGGGGGMKNFFFHSPRWEKKNGGGVGKKKRERGEGKRGKEGKRFLLFFIVH